MTFLTPPRLKRLLPGLLFGLLLAANAPHVAQANDTHVVDRQARLAPLRALAQGDARLNAVLTVIDQPTPAALQQASDELQRRIAAHDNDLLAKMFYGYAQLFLATDYLHKKNYMRAAELSKVGFFFVDEAAESDEQNWRIRFLRARMDAFTPKVNGRCVIALKDLKFLDTLTVLPADLKPFLLLMKIRAQQNCEKPDEARQSQQQLAALGDAGQALLPFVTEGIPHWQQAEITSVFQPLMQGTAP